MRLQRLKTRWTRKKYETWNHVGENTNVKNLFARVLLDAELAKYETWEGSDGFVSTLFENAGNFARTKKEGVGLENPDAPVEYIF